MHEFPDSIKPKTRITVSRNRTIALLVGVSGCLGSHLAEKLLERGVQVIGIDDFSFGNRKNLVEATKSKDFHLINGSIDDDFFSVPENIKDFGLPRLDYAFFVAESGRSDLYSRGIVNFLKICRLLRDQQMLEAKRQTGETLSKRQIDLDQNLVKSEKPKIVLASSINLYASKLDKSAHQQKEAEIRFAKVVKYYKLNARVVRIAPIYGPRMHFRESDPMVRLIQSSLLGKIQEETTVMDFSTRAIYIDDAVTLLLKAGLSGSTAEKIYDGALLHPIKASDVRSILVDPLWSDMKGVHLTELPEWSTPNLKRTIKELSWHPHTHLIDGLRETIAYFVRNGSPDFNDHDLEVPDIKEESIKQETKRWSFAAINEEENIEEPKQSSEKKEESREEYFEENKKGIWSQLKLKALPLFLVLIVFFGLVYPAGDLVVGGLSIRSNLQASKEAVERADFNKANQSLSAAHANIREIKQLVDSLAVVQRLGVFKSEIGEISQLVNLAEEGIEGSKYALTGSQDLFEATKVISGESDKDPKKLYSDAQVNLIFAGEKLTKVQARLEDEEFLDNFHPEIKSRAADFAQKLKMYSTLVEKGRVLSVLIPNITSVEGEKRYLLLVEDNLEQRPAGGVVVTYGNLTFKDGKLTEFKIEDSNSLDNRLKDVIPVSLEVANDLKVDRLFLRDSSIDPDFPTSARQAEYIYRRVSNNSINGVIAVNLNALSGLVKAVGGVEVVELNDKLTGDDLIPKYLSFKKAQTPTPSKRNYLTLVSEQVFNKIFFVKDQNWPEVISKSGSSLVNKDMVVYLSDPQALSLLSSENWSGILPQGSTQQDGEYADFLAVVDTNLSGAPLNYYVQKTTDLKTQVSSEYQLSHQLSLRYKNPAPEDSFNGGVYRERIKVYLPLGVSLNKAELGGVDVAKDVSEFSDHNRQAFSLLFELGPGEEKLLTIDYSVTSKLELKNNELVYRLDVFKQSGSSNSPLTLNFIYPKELKAKTDSFEVLPSESEGVSLSTRLNNDKSFVFNFQKTP